MKCSSNKTLKNVHLFHRSNQFARKKSFSKQAIEPMELLKYFKVELLGKTVFKLFERAIEAIKIQNSFRA